jgi:group I intron endonuclease
MAIVPQDDFTQHTFDFDALADQIVEHVPHVFLVPSQDQKYWWSDLEHLTIPKKKSGIYAIVNIRNGHFYIGSAVSLCDRKSEHFCDLRDNKHHSSYLQNAYNFYGVDAFRFVIVERVTNKEALIEREQHYIDTLNPEYNILRVAGSYLGHKHTPESIELMRISATGREHTPETKEKLRIINLGKTLTPEAKEKSRLASIGREHSPESIERTAAAHRGKPLSPKTKEKISESLKGKPLSEKHKVSISTALKGKPKSPDAIEKTAAAHRGSKHTDEANEKNRLAHLGKKKSPDEIARRNATRKANREKREAEQ